MIHYGTRELWLDSTAEYGHAAGLTGGEVAL